MIRRMNSYWARAGTLLLFLSLANACDKTEDVPGETGAAGAASGGVASGGVASGGIASGGVASGGVASGGVATGGVATGGQNGAGQTGGASAQTGTVSSSTLGLALPVALRTAGDFTILAKSGVSTVPTSAITGDVGLSPAAATFITGFSLKADATNAFATSTQVTGNLYAADFVPPTPANLTKAVDDMLLAFADAAGRAPDVTELGAGNVGGMTLTPGVYKWTTGLTIPTDVTLNGSATAVWIFQIAQNLTLSNGTKVVLAGGALAKNVFWQVTGLVELGTTAHCEGVILTQTSVTLATGASLNGRLLAQTAVSIDSSTVVEPAL